MGKILDTALTYAKNGLHVIPVDRATKYPLTEHGSIDATADPETIKSWWRRWPEANVAIATGKEYHLIVIDLDKGHGGGLDDGVENLRAWEAVNGQLPNTWTAVTGTGGQHLYFWTDTDFHNVQNDQPDELRGVDIRCYHGYVVAPPSVNVDGNEYFWDIAPDETKIKNCDKQIKKLYEDLKPEKEKSASDVPDGINEGQRNGTLLSLAGKLRKYDGLTEPEIAATLQTVNRTRCKPPLSEKEVAGIAKSVCRYPAGQLEQEDTPQTPFTEYPAAEYLKTGQFETDIDYFKKYKERKAGFENIDKYLTLFPGLAALGGSASMGKTTFCVQMADNLIARGETVLYFSMEQEPIELITKSLARRLYNRDPATPIDNVQIKGGAKSERLDAVREEYQRTANRFIIVRCNFMTTAAEIRDYIDEYIRKTGIKPIVFIDYLQLINPPDDFRGDTRAATDLAVKTFKAMQLKNELLVILVSNFNRSAYETSASYSDFKESGMIEYTCDYIWELQMSIISEDRYWYKIGKKKGVSRTTDYDKEKMMKAEMKKYPKPVEFVSLKNRNGEQRFNCRFEYWNRFDYFRVDDTEPEPLEIPDDIEDEEDDGFVAMTDDQISIFDGIDIK